MQTEVLVTGVGGQGIQLATRVVAKGAIAAGRAVMFTSEFGGEMRGGISTATLIVGDLPLRALPVVPTAGAVVAMHDRYWPEIRERLRPGGLLLINSSLWESPVPDGYQVLEVPATQTALDRGYPMAATLLLAGAFAAATGIAEVEGLCAAMEASVPAYRRQHLAGNLAALRAGAEFVPARAVDLFAAGGAARKVAAV